MSNLVGLFIDTHVIGWTLLDQKTKRIKAMGCRTFPIGCENFGTGRRESSRKSIKRFKRSTRLRYARALRRKIKVIEILIENDMCPLTTVEFKKWKREKKFPEQALRSWFKMNPYALRVKALKGKITLYELGRILYQFSVRRGFPLVDRNSGMKESAIFTGIPEMNRPGILHTAKNIRNRSLGSYLNSLLPEEGKSYKRQKERIRNRFLSREMYREEAHAIWEYQSQFYPVFSENLKISLIGTKDTSHHRKGAVFFQRPLKSQKFRVGNCQYEKNKTKCCVSSLAYQDYLAYGWINSIKKNGNELNDKERDMVFHYYKTNKKFNFRSIRSLLNATDEHFNKKDDEVIQGSFINATLSSNRIFGDSWFLFDESTKEDIWHALYFFNNEEKLRMHAQQRWNLTYEQAKRLSGINLDKRYAPISKKAAKNILFFLKRGVSRELAVVLGGVKNSVTSWDTIAPSDVNFIIDRVISIYKRNKIFGFIPRLQEFLIDEMQLTDFQISKLYGQSAQMVDIPLQKKFKTGKEADKEIFEFRSPLMIASLFQTRKVINSIIAEYGDIDEIQAELAADLKVNKYQRYLYRIDQRRLKRLRTEYQKLLGSIAENVTPMNLLKLELWHECKETCPYTGEKILFERLFTDDVSIVYIHPWGRSLNDGIINKTLCVKHFVPQILECTPFEYFSEFEDEVWEKVVQRASRLFANTKEYPSSFKKFKRFVKRYYQRDFLKHQLNDPNMLSKEVMCYLSKVSPKVSVSPGHATHYFIDYWQLNRIFPKEVYKNPKMDLRYSALLSYINANRSLHYLQALAERNKYQKQKNRTPFPIPFDDFQNEVEYHIHSILVSHKQSQKVTTERMLVTKKGENTYHNLCVTVNGSIHKETIFGLRTPPDRITSYHIRKPITAIKTKKHIEKVVDPVIRKMLMDAVIKGVGPDEDDIPPGILTQKNDEGVLKSKIYLPNAKGHPVPVNKVRLREYATGGVQLKKGINQHVNLRKNHHAIVFYNKAGEYDEQVITFWEAVRRKTSGQPVYQLPTHADEFVTTLEINDLFLLGVDALKEPLDTESNSFLAKHLYRVQKLSTRFYEFRLVNNSVLREMEYPTYIRISNFGNRKTGWKTYNPIKVNVSPIGIISRAKEAYYRSNKIFKYV